MKLILSLFCCFGTLVIIAQPITGVWRGKITNGSGMFATTGKVELKLIKNGDSLVGTCYYFSSGNAYMRYSVKGYFDKEDNAVHWWDDQFLEVKPVGKTKVGVYNYAMRSEADFNCPGGKVMKLDGKSQIGEDGPDFVLHFDKMEKPVFHDEWDNVIEGYFTGMSDQHIIDSVYAITPAYNPGIPADAIAKSGKSIDNKKADEKAVPPAEKEISPLVVTAKTESPGPLMASTKTTPPVEKPAAITSPEQSTVKKDLAVEKQLAVLTAVGGTAGNPPAEKPSIQTQADEVIKQATSVTTNTTTTAGKIPVEKTPVQPQPEVAKQTPPIVTGTTGTAVKPAVKNPSGQSQPEVAKNTAPVEKRPESLPAGTVAKTTPVLIKQVTIPEKIDPIAVEKFISRKKINQGEIPLVGDTIELNFYDNADVDGDSISLFLNGKLLFNHVLLSTQAYTFKLDAKDLPAGSELTMVAENLGSIPPNTAYMMAIVDGVRYSARLESTEQSSGVIKLMRR